MFIDTHAHYDDEQFNEDRDALLLSLPQKGVGAVINCGQDAETSARCVALAEQYDFVYATVGIHPHEAKKYCEAELEKIKALAANKKVVAIGETGLDYHYDFSPRDIQKENFRANIRLASELGLPVVVHDREAHQDTFDILSEEGVPAGKAVYHCFSGSAEYARMIAKKGWYFSVGGSVTFKNASKLREAVAAIPDELLMLETDCPYMAPVPLRGTRNNSSNIIHTAGEIAAIRGSDFESICELTNRNAEKFFGIFAQKK